LGWLFLAFSIKPKVLTNRVLEKAHKRFTMKIMKCFLIFTVLLFAMALTGCSSQPAALEPPPVAPIPGAPEGTWRATAYGDGFARLDDILNPWFWYLENVELGRPISVTLTVEDGFIISVEIYGPDESHNWGAGDGNITYIINTSAPRQIMQRNAIDVDIVAMSTRTANGIIQGGQAALISILAGGGEEITGD